MFSMSVKSVPGSLVLIAPSGIGVPVAATPGFVPHDDVDDDALALVVAALELEVLAAVLLLELLLPHPARTVTPTVAMSARLTRHRGKSWYLLTDLSSSAQRSDATPDMRGNN
jgi:hypothetical protein